MSKKKASIRDRESGSPHEAPQKMEFLGRSRDVLRSSVHAREDAAHDGADLRRMPLPTERQRK